MARKGHVTATDNADADAILAVVEHAVGSNYPGVRKVATDAIAKLLADKREEWIACAMLRAERLYQLKARKVPERTAVVRGTDTKEKKE